MDLRRKGRRLPQLRCIGRRTATTERREAGFGSERVSRCDHDVMGVNRRSGRQCADAARCTGDAPVAASTTADASQKRRIAVPAKPAVTSSPSGPMLNGELRVATKHCSPNPNVTRATPASAQLRVARPLQLGDRARNQRRLRRTRAWAEGKCSLDDSPFVGW